MKISLLILYTFSVIILSAGCQLFDSPVKEKTAAGLSGNPLYEALSDSIGRYPGNASLYLRRAELLSQKDYHDLAFPDYRKAWELQPDESTALAYTSNLFISGRESEAIRLLQECLNKFPDNTEFSRRLSEAYRQSGRPQEALSQYSAMLNKDPANFEAWYEKGLLLTQMKDTANAISCLERAYELQPLQLFGLTLANLYAETKDQRAIVVSDQILSRDSAREFTDALFIKGVYFANVNRPSQALEQFEECIKRDWKFTDAYIEKGIILYGQKNLDEALKTFALAAKVSNTDADAYYWMGRCYEKIGNKEEAMLNFNRALALDRDFPEARERLERLK